MTLATSESKLGCVPRPSASAVSTRTPFVGGLNLRAGSQLGLPFFSANTRACTEKPRGAAARPRSASSNAAPSASASWTATRSTPAISSVTVCSTCKRGLHSMK